jgi:hypothetical protein
MDCDGLLAAVAEASRNGGMGGGTRADLTCH